MYYVDTNAVLDYAFPCEVRDRHKKVKALIDGTRGDCFISSFADLKIKVFDKYFEAIRLAPNIKLHSRDTLHVAYAKELKNEGKIKFKLKKEL